MSAFQDGSPIDPISFESTSAISAEHVLPLPRNFLSIVSRENPIKGTYVIDNTIQVPSFAREKGSELPPHRYSYGQPPKELLPNARFATIRSEIELVLHLRGEGLIKIEVELNNTSKNEKDIYSLEKKIRQVDRLLQVTVVSKDPRSILHLTIKGEDCSTFLSFPDSFTALIKGGAESGSLTFSPELEKRTKTYSENHQRPWEGRYFVGEPKMNGDWDGDVLEVTLLGEEKKRNIWIQDVKEDDEARKFREKLRQYREAAKRAAEAGVNWDACALGTLVVIGMVLAGGFGYAVGLPN